MAVERWWFLLRAKLNSEEHLIRDNKYLTLTLLLGATEGRAVRGILARIQLKGKPDVLYAVAVVSILLTGAQQAGQKSVKLLQEHISKREEKLFVLYNIYMYPCICSFIHLCAVRSPCERTDRNISVYVLHNSPSPTVGVSLQLLL